MATEKPQGEPTRRHLLSRVAQATAALSVVVGVGPSDAASAAVSSPAPPAPRSPRPTAYQITGTNPPQMQPFTTSGEKRIVGEIASGPAVVIGDHGTEADRLTEAKFLKQLADKLGGGRVVVVALASAVDKPETQQAIDAFVTRATADDAAAEAALLGAEGAEWAEGESAESVLPVLRTARKVGGMRVRAVGVSSSVVGLVRAKGLEALGTQSQSYVKEAKKFVEAVSLPGFKRYSDVVVSDQFERYQATLKLNEASGSGGTSGSGGGGGGGKGSEGAPLLTNFFASRIFEDQVVAERAFEAVQEAPGALLVLLASCDSVKFGFGCQSRLERLATKEDVKIPSIIVNPTAADSLALSTNIKLTLGYGDELATSRPLANFIFFSSSPAPNLLTHMLNSQG